MSYFLKGQTLCLSPQSCSNRTPLTGLMATGGGGRGSGGQSVSPCKASAPGEVMTQSSKDRTPAFQTQLGKLLPSAREALGDWGLADCQLPLRATRYPESRFQGPTRPHSALPFRKCREAGNSSDLGILQLTQWNAVFDFQPRQLYRHRGICRMPWKSCGCHPVT